MDLPHFKKLKRQQPKVYTMANDNNATSLFPFRHIVPKHLQSISVEQFCLILILCSHIRYYTKKEWVLGCFYLSLHKRIEVNSDFILSLYQGISVLQRSYGTKLSFWNLEISPYFPIKIVFPHASKKEESAIKASINKG